MAKRTSRTASTDAARARQARINNDDDEYHESDEEQQQASGDDDEGSATGPPPPPDFSDWEGRIQAMINAKAQQLVAAETAKLVAIETAKLTVQFNKDKAALSRQIDSLKSQMGRSKSMTEAFIPISADTITKIIDGKYVDYATIHAGRENFAEETHTVVIQGGEERIMKPTLSRREVPDIGRWLDIHLSVTAILIRNAAPRSHLVAMAHHGIVVRTRAASFPWKAVLDYDKNKRKNAESAANKYAHLLEYNLQEEQRLSQSLSRIESEKGVKRPRKDMITRIHAGYKLLKEGKCRFGSQCRWSHKPRAHTEKAKPTFTKPTHPNYTEYANGHDESPSSRMTGSDQCGAMRKPRLTL